MTPQRAAELLPVIKAFSEGALVQYRPLGNDLWLSIQEPTWRNDTEYRIKPKTIKYRRYLSARVERGLPERVWTAHGEVEVFWSERQSTFIRWIDTEWQEEEII